MNRISRLAVAVLASGGVGLAGLGLAGGAAQADPGSGTWCPGQPLPYNGPTDVVWDMTVCHTWYSVHYKQGNVGDYIWADSPPPVPPPIIFAPPFILTPGCSPGCL